MYVVLLQVAEQLVKGSIWCLCLGLCCSFNWSRSRTCTVSAVVVLHFLPGGERGAELCAWSLGETGHDGVELSVSVWFPVVRAGILSYFPCYSTWWAFMQSDMLQSDTELCLFSVLLLSSSSSEEVPRHPPLPVPVFVTPCIPYSVLLYRKCSPYIKSNQVYFA